MKYQQESVAHTHQEVRKGCRRSVLAASRAHTKRPTSLLRTRRLHGCCAASQSRRRTARVEIDTMYCTQKLDLAVTTSSAVRGEQF